MNLHRVLDSVRNTVVSGKKNLEKNKELSDMDSTQFEQCVEAGGGGG